MSNACLEISASRSAPTFASDVAVAIVSHNGRKKLPKTLEGLAAAGCPQSRITLVDVASTDDQIQWLEAQWPGVRVIRLEENIGPGPGRNQMIRQCRQPYLLLMDSDGQVLPDTVGAMRQVMDEDPEIAVVSPLVVYGQHPEVIQYADVGLHFLGEASNAWQGQPVSRRGGGRCDVGVAPVCSLLIRCEILHEMDLFDERYFVCKEDGDFIHRINVAGYRVVEEPAAVVVHHCSPRTDGMFRRQLANGWHLMLKNYQKRTLVLIAPAALLHACLQFFLLASKGHARTFAGAVADLIGYLPSLRQDRRRVARTRRRHDTEILRGDGMLVRRDFQRGSVATLIRVYQRVTSLYWRGVCVLLGPLNRRPPEAAAVPGSDD